MNPTNPLITLAEAQRILREAVQPGPTQNVPLELALGCVLAQDVHCDIDMPPFDRAMMDGYAVRAADVANPGARLHCVGQIAAGAATNQPLDSGQAVQINTGAPMPPGADTVVPVEDTRFDDSTRTVTVGGVYQSGKHITPRAAYVRAGDGVLSAGMRLGPAQIAVAATSGAAHVAVYKRPSVAVLTTGDELVHHTRKPQGPQIRNSNSPMLEALLHADGMTVTPLGVAIDDRKDLHRKIAAGLEHDCLCITGGVSMGQFDFVPEILNKCGVRFAFQKVAIRPGKPTAFGLTAPIRTATVRERSDQSRARKEADEHGNRPSRTDALPLSMPRHASPDSPRYVFALPGNPISAYVGYVHFVRPALSLMQGLNDVFPPMIAATLDGTQAPAGKRESFWPANVTVDASGGLIAKPLNWSGSGDPFGMADANAFIVRPAQSPEAKTGDSVPVLLLDAL